MVVSLVNWALRIGTMARITAGSVKLIDLSLQEQSTCETRF
ncbi:hypothetical protein [Helicobacter sp.]|nr:hypothetical protein [Helicobacter sp.]